MPGETASAGRQRRLAVALAFALALHALVLVFAFGLRAPPVVPETITLELRTSERPAVVDKQPSPPTPPVVVRRTPRRRAMHASRVEAKPSPPIATPAPIALPSPPVASSPPISNPPAVQLFPLGSIASGNLTFRAGNGDDALDRLDDAEPTGDGVEAERARVGMRVGRQLAQTSAESRVADGLVDPYFSGLARDARGAFRPSLGLVGGKEGKGLLASVSNMANSWSAAGKQWAKSGSPYPDGEKPTGLVDRHEAMRDPAGNSGFDGADFMARWNAGDFQAPGLAVEVELVQDAKGVPLRTRVVRSSGNPEFDDAASKAIASAATGRLAPAHGLGLGGHFIRSRWKLEAKYVTQTAALTPDPTGASRGAGVTPGLTVGGTMDLATGEAHADVPGSTKVITKVTLVAVYGGEWTPRAE